MRGDDLIHMPQPQLLGAFQHARQFSKIDSIACHPGGEYEEQARQFLPCLTEVELIRGILRLLTDYFVANEQLGDISWNLVAVARAAMKIEIDDSRPNSISLGQYYSRQGDRRMAIGIAGQCADFIDRQMTEYPHGERRTIAPDSPRRQEAQSAEPLVVDHGKKGHVEPLFDKTAEKSRWHVERQ